MVTYAVGAAGPPGGHEAATRAAIARRLAAVAGFDYVGEYDAHASYVERPYFVPSDTLTRDAATRLRIDDARDLFGGVVPSAFAATKMITHPVLDENAQAPDGWEPAFPKLVADSVLSGFSAFTRADAVRAGRRLLERGAVRVKLASGIAGIGQWVAHDTRELDAILERVDPAEITRAGIVIEENLEAVSTKSVGQICVAGLKASYCGEQRLTSNNEGREVYGGSELHVVRGGFDLLLELDVPEEMRVAISQARVYDDAAHACFHGFFASRRNYDVAQGEDGRGAHRSGVLEQSWRLGGASGAEMAALEAFRADPSLRAVRASSREAYGANSVVPDHADIYFRGVDPHVGPLTKYTLIEPHAHTR